MAVQRSGGITFSAVLAILGSALLLLFALATALSALPSITQPTALPSYTRPLLLIVSGVMVTIAGWGIATAIGLFRLRPWARWSLLAFSAFLVFMGVSGGLALAFSPIPAASGTLPGVVTLVKVFLLGFYLVMTLVGAIWLFYFNTAGVRSQFGGGPAAEGPGIRPVSVTVIAWFLIAGGVVCLGLAASPLPAALLAMTLTGWPARALYLAFAGMELWAGLGLLRLQPLSRVLAIGFFGFTSANTALFSLLPGYAERMRTFLEIFPADWQVQTQQTPAPGATVGFIAGLLASAVPIYFLIARRRAFGPPGPSST